MGNPNLMSAYEQLLVIKGTHYGFLTLEEIEIVCAYNNLDICDQTKLLDKLNQTGGEIIDSKLLFQILENKQRTDNICVNSTEITFNSESTIQLAKLLRSNLPSKLRLMWMHEIVHDDDAIQVLMCISQGKTYTEIISQLKKTQEEIQTTEHQLLHAYKRAYKKYRQGCPRAHRRKSIRDYYN